MKPWSFLRNLLGVVFFWPMILCQGFAPFRTRGWRHFMRPSTAGAMYCFFTHRSFAAADSSLNYAAPVFTPLRLVVAARIPDPTQMFMVPVGLCRPGAFFGLWVGAPPPPPKPPQVGPGAKNPLILSACRYPASLLAAVPRVIRS